MSSSKPRIGLIFTTQDRYELARMALTSATEGLDPNVYDVTVLWLDGSVNVQALDFFEGFCSRRVRLVKASGYRNLGAARVIQLGMNRLKELGPFDWIGMLESDCYFLQGWLDAGFRAVQAARADGVRVGAFAAEGWRTRRWHADYLTIEVLCASNALFLPEAWDLVPPASITHNFPKRYFADLCTVPMMHPSPVLGWDWIFAIALHHAGGFAVVTTPRANVLNCLTPDDHKDIFKSIYVHEDFTPPVLCERPPEAPRREADWETAVRLCHASSDAAILQCEALHDLSYVAIDFLQSWHCKEIGDGVWWRWADGAADILIHNSSERRLPARLSFGLRMLNDNQTVRVFWNGEDLGVFESNTCCRREIEIAPGTGVLRCEPVMPGIRIGSDPRRLAFSLFVEREGSEASHPS